MTDTTYTTGQTTALLQPEPTTRRTAWGVLGTDLQDTAMTDPQAAMDAAGLLGWDVHKRPLQTGALLETADGLEMVTPLPVPGHYASVRSDGQGGHTALGVVGERYAPIQNEAYLPLFDAVLANEPGAQVVAAGAIQGGRRVFMAVRMPALDVPVGKVDPVQMYLVGQSSHDGSSAFTFSLTPVRLFCTNQLRGIREGRGVVDQWRVRHTRTHQAQLDQVRHMLGDAREWAARFSQDADRLLTTAVSDDQFRQLVDALYPAPGRDVAQAAHTRHTARLDDLDGLWRDSVTIPDEVRGTGWAAFNAVTEYVDHYQAAGSKTTGPGPTVARAERNMLGRDQGIKARAWDAVLAMA